MSTQFRKTGLAWINDVPWGTHFCHVFNRAQTPLLELPFLAAGLQAHEFCWWILPNELSAPEARGLLRSVVPDLDHFLESGQLELISALTSGAAGGSLQWLIDLWQVKLKLALSKGFEGMRVVHAISWSVSAQAVTQFEEHLENWLLDVPALVLCLVPNDPHHLAGVLQMPHYHSRLLTQEDGVWQQIAGESARRQAGEPPQNAARPQAVLEGVLLLDEQGQVFEWSRAMERITGVLRAAAVGRFPWDIFEEIVLPGPANAAALAMMQAEVLDRKQPGQDEAQLHLWEAEICRPDGTRRVLEFGIFLYPDPQKLLLGILARDITERQLAELGLTRQLAFTQRIIDTIPSPVVVKSSDHRIALVNQALCQLLGYTQEELIGKTNADFFPSELAGELLHYENRVLHEDRELQTEHCFRGEDGSERWFLLQRAPGAALDGSAMVVEVITELTLLKQAQRIERERRLIADTLKDIAVDLNSTLESAEVLRRAIGHLQRVLAFDASSILLFDKGQLKIVHASGGTAQQHRLIGSTLNVDPSTDPFFCRVKQTGAVVVSDTCQTPDWCRDPSMAWVGSHLSVYLQNKHIAGFLNLEAALPNTFKDTDVQRLQAIAQQISLALENAWLFENARRRADEMAAIVAFSADLRKAERRHELLPVILDSTLKLLNALGAALVFRSGAQGEVVVELGLGMWEGLKSDLLPEINEYTIQVMESIHPQVVTDLRLLKMFQKEAEPLRLSTAMCVPLVAQDQPVGAIWVGLESPLAADELNLLLAIAEISANALHRAELNEKTEERLQQLTTLHAVETAVNASLDVGIVMGILLDRLTHSNGATAADVLLLNPYNQTFELSSSRGFRSVPPRILGLRLSEDWAGRAVLERRSVLISSLAGLSERWPRYRLMRNEKIQTLMAVPLFSKGQVKGVLEVFFRRLYRPDQEWMEFIEGLGNQLAIAIDNSSLVSELQRSNLELLQAYDVTLEGWVRTLRLRNDESEEHTIRLVDLTVALARALKIEEVDLVHIRRGVLLHDIGKLGIPDSILKNPGALNEEEWQVMRQHPQTAYELLSPVAYLRPILDIPYCHHERWDGSGYPRGLIGEQIPLAARVFAVVDVWDALTSHRIYRPAWPQIKAAEYLREQAGILFDPRVVEVFLQQCIRALPDQTPTLLIVDDEEGVLHTLARSLRRDYNVLAATRGQKALEIVKNTPVAVILTDQRMPEMTGVELLQHVAEISPTSMGVVISAYSDTPAVLAAMQLGNICGVLSKPWTSQELRDRLSEAVRLSRRKAAGSGLISG